MRYFGVYTVDVLLWIFVVYTRYSSAQNGDATLQLIALVRSELPTDEAFKEWALLKETSVRFVELVRPIEPAVQFVPKLVNAHTETLSASNLISDNRAMLFHKHTNAQAHSCVSRRTGRGADFGGRTEQRIRSIDVS